MPDSPTKPKKTVNVEAKTFRDVQKAIETYRSSDASFRQLFRSRLDAIDAEPAAGPEVANDA